jgi:glycosyltransferase involved in cell wall biosynthesis
MNALTNRRITIVTQYYWPEHVGIAPYSTRLAEHLADIGAVVNVVTAMPHYPEWRIDPAYKRRVHMREERRGVAVDRRWHYVPARQSALRRAGYEASLFAHSMVRGSPESDAVIGVIPSLSTGAIARVYARRRSCKYGIIVQDLSTQAVSQSGITKADVVTTTTRAVEGWVLSGAARVAVVSPRFKPHVETFGVAPDRISVLRNWVEDDVTSAEAQPPTTTAAIRKSFGWDDDEVIVLHAGNMGLKQGLEHVVEAARLASGGPLPLRFVLMGDGSQRPAIEQRAAGLANVQFLPNMPRDRCSQIMSAADVLLVNERGSIVDMALPSKLTSYFAAGGPVVAAVSDEGTTAEEVRRAGGGLVVAPEDPKALLDALALLAADPGLAAALGAKGADYAERELSAGAVLAHAETFVRDLLA